MEIKHVAFGIFWIASVACGGAGSGIGAQDYSSLGFVQWKKANGGNDHWYKAVSQTTSISWRDAERIAEGLEGHLVTIQSDEENTFVSGLVSDSKFWVNWSGAEFGPWLGGRAPDNRVNPTDGWNWVTSEVWSFTKWIPGEPSNGGSAKNENGLQYARQTSASAPFSWNDVASSGAAENAGGGVTSYIIEIDGIRPVTP